MTKSHAEFSGSIPAVYDTCLGPLLFEFAAADLADRVARVISRGRVLELACGTGILTHFLRQQLPAEVEILATDLNPSMLDFAREHRGGLPRVQYELADALALPYEGGSYDAVICQFGIMFFPDLSEGLSEIRRVLSPGGYVACNAWDSLEANPVAGVAHDTIARYFELEPPTFLKTPFGSCELDATLEAFRALGFERIQGEVVDATVERPSAVEVARGFVMGNPGVLEIQERATAEPEIIIAVLADELERVFGPAPLRIPLRALVFTGHAPG
jgi:ubiquinone/menaquinone biosynthesis C-methylase UbiE